MSKITHNRPQLRLLDNLRRELGKMSNNLTAVEFSQNWPPLFHLVCQRDKARIAFFELLDAINDWCDAGDVLSFSPLPPRLQKAAHEFARVRVHHPYDNQYRGLDWLGDLEKSDVEEARAWGALLAVFVRPQHNDA